ncbi:MAG: thiamine diphosphokinase [Spirochaetaceae bacterium]
MKRRKLEEYRRVDGLAVVGGEAPEPRNLEPWLQGNPLCVAADSGLDTARRLGLEASVVVGDMDSISDPSLLRGFREEQVRSVPPDKDETDTELALAVLREHRCRRVLVVGGGGGRMDHLLAILALFERGDHPAAWITAHDEIISVDEGIDLVDMKEARVSFFPIGPETCTMRSHGLKWPLDALTWRHGDHGVSNMVTAGHASVDVVTGRLLMVRRLA